MVIHSNHLSWDRIIEENKIDYYKINTKLEY